MRTRRKNIFVPVSHKKSGQLQILFRLSSRVDYLCCGQFGKIMYIKRFIMLACATVICCGVAAAQGGESEGFPPEHQEGHRRPERLSPEQQARMIVDRMDSLLCLSGKQYDKLYKLHLRHVRQMESERKEGDGERAGGGPGGPGGPGGNPGSGGNPPSRGGMGQGGHGGPPSGGAGRPPHDMSSGGPGQMQNHKAGDDAQKEKLNKKIRKILTDGQYAVWEGEEIRRQMDIWP